MGKEKDLRAKLGELQGRVLAEEKETAEQVKKFIGEVASRARELRVFENPAKIMRLSTHGIKPQEFVILRGDFTKGTYVLPSSGEEVSLRRSDPHWWHELYTALSTQEEGNLFWVQPSDAGTAIVVREFTLHEYPTVGVLFAGILTNLVSEAAGATEKAAA